MTKLNQATGAVLLLVLSCGPAGAQQGHPLTGSWSGERSVDGRDSRVLMVLDLQRDQNLSGYVIENRARIPLKSATLNPGDWSVNLVLEGRDRDGDPVSYEVEGTIENLGSWNAREIVGTWTDGSGSGDFRVVLN
jgi:hypothetical protein